MIDDKVTAPIVSFAGPLPVMTKDSDVWAAWLKCPSDETCDQLAVVALDALAERDAARAALQVVLGQAHAHEAAEQRRDQRLQGAA